MVASDRRDPLPPRILIVDDSPIERRVVNRLLKKKLPECQTLEAESGTSALEVLEVEPVDLIITDLRMPDGDGLFLVNRVVVQHPQIPIILMTSYGSEEIAAEALKAGAASYIPKRRLDLDLNSAVENLLMLPESEFQFIYRTFGELPIESTGT